MTKLRVEVVAELVIVVEGTLHTPDSGGEAGVIRAARGL